MSRWLPGIVSEHKHWSDKLHSLHIQADIAPWQAGQFIKIALDIDGERVGRPYSLVNPPAHFPLEIYYVLVPSGLLTPRLVGLQPGDPIWVMPEANGFLVADEIPAAPHLWLMATGTGIGPFLAMLEAGVLWPRYEHVVLVYAVRQPEDMQYRDRIAALAAGHAGRMTFIPVVSRVPMPGALSGRMTQAIENGQLEITAGLPLAAATSQVALCGNPAMVEEVTAILMRRGMRKHRRRSPGQISAETYW